MISRLTFHSRKMNISHGDTLNEAEIIKRITKNFSAPFKKDKDGKEVVTQEHHFDEEKLSVVRHLFRQLIDNKLEKQLNDIENRKKVFAEQFAVELY